MVLFTLSASLSTKISWILVVKELFDNIFVSITASSTSQIIFCIELNICDGMVQEQLDDICASFFTSQQKCSPSKIISCI